MSSAFSLCNAVPWQCFVGLLQKSCHVCWCSRTLLDSNWRASGCQLAATLAVRQCTAPLSQPERERCACLQQIWVMPFIKPSFHLLPSPLSPSHKETRRAVLIDFSSRRLTFKRTFVNSRLTSSPQPHFTGLLQGHCSRGRTFCKSCLVRSVAILNPERETYSRSSSFLQS